MTVATGYQTARPPQWMVCVSMISATHRRASAAHALFGMIVFFALTVAGAGTVIPVAMPDVQRCGEQVVAGRKVVRFEHASQDQWGYDVPQRDVFFVAYPKDPSVGKVPLRVSLHSAGGSGESEMPGNIKARGQSTFYELFLDCHRNRATDWWWGWHAIRRTPERYADDLCPTEKRVLATLSWVQANFDIDPDRIYLQGTSMGGSGSLGLGLFRGDLFAAISVCVPAGADHAVYRVAGRQDSAPPPLFNFSSQTDRWSKGQEALIALCQTNRYSLAFAWGPYGHINDIGKFHAAVADFPWLSIRKNEAYPVFTRASSDNTYPGFKNTQLPAQQGQINGFFRWKNLEDSPQRFVIELRLATAADLKSPVVMPVEAVADVTLRRLQRFQVAPLGNVVWRLTAEGRTLQAGKATADGTGLLTLPVLKITGTPAALEVTLPYKGWLPEAERKAH